jgi:PAS domain S-box-containing protein
MRLAAFSSTEVRALLDALPDGVVLCRPDGVLEYANAQAERLFGYGPRELVGQSVEVLVPERLRERHARLREEFARAPRRRPMGSGLDLAARRKDGSEMRVEISLGPLETAAGPLILGVIRDVTERKQAEEALRASEARFAGILDIAEDAIISIDAAQRVVLFNQGAERIFGYSAADVLGRPLDVLLPAGVAAGHRGHVEDFGRSGEASRKMGQRQEVFGVRKGGEHFPAEASISRLETPQGAVYTAVLRDITERKKAEEAIRRLNEGLEERVRERAAELAESNRQLAEKNAENETFVYSVSHDLRSPLVNLEGFSKELGLSCDDLRALLGGADVPEAVRRRALGLLDSDMAESVQYIRTAVGRLSGIIDALLRLSRAGRVAYQPRRVDVRRVVERVAAAMRVTVEEKGAEVVVGDLPPGWADPTAVEQVFANLIGNALNYLDPRRPGRVEVGAAAPEGAGAARMNVYLVKDNGLGIPAAYRGKVFQAFQRLHPQAAPGEGMGLAIVRRIVERHGGQVRVESAEGEGSAFFVTLPAPPGGSSEPEA